MQRLFEASLTVLLTTTLGVPAQANPATTLPNIAQPTPAETTPIQPVTPTAQPNVEARKVPLTPVQPASQADTLNRSDRDRLVLERRLQKLIPAE